MKSATAALWLFSASWVLAAPAALAQAAAPPKAAARPSAGPNHRLFQQFIPDPEIISKQWYSIEVRWQNGAVPPIEEADGLLFTPTVAVSPISNLEVGGTVSYIDYELDSPAVRPGSLTEFDGDSGLGDLTVWGKYRLFSDAMITVSAGASLDLPTGSEDDGLGTGKVTPGAFGGVRVKAGDGHFVGNAWLRFNRDAEVFNTRLNGRTSTFIGGGYIWEAYQDWVVSGELTVQSERYETRRDSRFALGSSDFRATAGIQFFGIPHSHLRAAASIGLSDGAPDFEIILGYAYSY